jgi:hypothetical protein
MLGPADPGRAGERAELKQAATTLLGEVKEADPELFKTMAGPFSLAGSGVGAGAGARGAGRARGRVDGHDASLAPAAGARRAGHLQRPLQRGAPQGAEPVPRVPGRSGQRAAGAALRRAAMRCLPLARGAAAGSIAPETAIGAEMQLAR